MTGPQPAKLTAIMPSPQSSAALLESARRTTADNHLASVPVAGRRVDSSKMARPALDLEQRLDLLEEQFRFLIEHAAHITVILDRNRTIRYVSPVVERMLGYSPRVLRGTDVLELIHADDLPMIQQRLEYRMQHAGVGEFVQFRAKHRDGSWRVLEAITTNRLDDPRISGLVVDARDITERVWTADRLQRNLGALLAIHDVDSRLGPSLDRQAIAQALLDAALQVAPIDGAAILLRNARGRLQSVESVGPGELYERVRRSSAARSASQTALRSGGACAFDVARGRCAPRLSGWILPLRIQGRVIGLLEVFGQRSLEIVDSGTLTTLADKAAAALERARLYRDLEERERRLADLVGRLLLAQEEDRRQVAYNIHDGLAQFAAAAHEHLEAFASRYRPRSDGPRDDLSAALDLTARTVREARCLIAGLRPRVLDDFGLAVAIASELQRLRSDTWEIEYTDQLGSERLPQMIETALFRVVQEALANVRKHANSRRVAIVVMRRGPSVHVEVRDWGRGFRPNAVLGSARPAEHVGLAGMQERIELLGGHCAIRSRPGGGTRITVDVPLVDGTKPTTRRDRARQRAQPPACDLKPPTWQ